MNNLNNVTKDDWDGFKSGVNAIRNDIEKTWKNTINKDENG